jgi:hypothetical protein
MGKKLSFAYDNPTSKPSCHLNNQSGEDWDAESCLKIMGSEDRAEQNMDNCQLFRDKTK